MSDINTGRFGTPLGDALREIAELRGLLAETVPDPEYRRMQDIEIERLREALKKAQGGVTDYAKQYVALRAEIDRLREALEKIAAGDFTITDDGVRLSRRIAGPFAKIALAALAPGSADRV